MQAQHRAPNPTAAAWSFKGRPSAQTKFEYTDRVRSCLMAEG